MGSTMASANGGKPNAPSRAENINRKTLQRAFARRVHKRWRQLRDAGKDLRQSYSPNAIHDLRVATRRLQALLDFAVRTAPSKPCAKLRKRLKRLRHALGNRRNIDVM